MKTIFKSLFASTAALLLVAQSATAGIWTSTCTVKNLMSGETYTESGSNDSEALNNALEECNSENDTPCVRVSCVSSDPTSGIDPRGFVCHSEDKLGRQWSATGSTMNQAREQAMDDCKWDAGVSCKVVKCSMAF
jgi:hypothetical protein